jgi:hypothetical protein
MSDATYGIDIVGHDRTAKGAKSAEKRLAAIPKRAGAAGQRYAQESERSLRRHTRSIVRTFSEVEQAGARVFGGRSITSGISGRLGGISAAARAADTGLGEAAAAGGVLEGTLGAIGVAAGATVGILAAAGYAAFKLADGWAKGAASIGRTAQIIGVSTTALTEFTAAAERAGVDKGTSAGSLGGLSQTLSDARYGRNPGAQALLAKLGVGMKLKGDGTVDVEAMLPALADAMQRQNSSGARTVASGLGISEAMIPFLRQGGASLRSEMKDAGQHAATLSDADVAMAQRIARKSVMAGQLGERGMSQIGRKTAEFAEPGYDAVLSGGQRLMDGASSFGTVVRDSFRPAAEKIDRAASRMERAGGLQIGGAVRAAGRFSAREIATFARRAQRLVPEAMGYGRSKAEAIALAANVQMESGGDHRSRESGGRGAGRGLIQWTDQARKRKFREVQGVDVEHATRDQQWRHIMWEIENRRGEKRGWDRALANGQDPAAIAAGYARYVERPKEKARDAAERAAVADAMVIQLDIRGLPPGASAKATGGRGARPAVSYGYAPGH